METSRREFVQLLAGAALAPLAANALGNAAADPAAGAPLKKLEAFDYQGVSLLDGPFKIRADEARTYYFHVSNDDILKGFRTKAGLAAPGKTLGGWCNNTSDMVLGQWLSAMARIAMSLNDGPFREKANLLMTEWGKCLPRLDCGHYIYDKYVCGLVDMATYAGNKEALPLLEQLTAKARKKLGTKRLNATDADTQGGWANGEIEWYTLPENLYRAYQLTHNDTYKDFAQQWLYPHYWDMFLEKNPRPTGFHGYSHVNTLSSAAMAYAVTRDDKYLKTIVNAYDFFQATQCFATGGYGPGEKLVAKGDLGDAIVHEPNAFLHLLTGRSFETPCGTWGVFKIVRYLQEFTGEARFGDWMERVLYNGIGSAVPMGENGKTFYYADYRLMGGTKGFHPDAWPCCSGTYFQCTADFPNLLYYKDAAGVAVNLYVPSTATWTQDGQPVTVTVKTDYPDDERVFLTVDTKQKVAFSLRLRVPMWAEGFVVRVNDLATVTPAKPGTWAEVKRAWSGGDRVEVQIRMSPRLVAIDEKHTNRVALVRGPVVFVKTAETTAANAHTPAEWITQDKTTLTLKSPTTATAVPFSKLEYGVPYQMYLDLKA